MSLLRLIFFLLVFWFVLSAIRSLLAGRKKKTPGTARQRTEGEEMVLDPQCHSYIPKSAAVSKSGQYFCSQECARLYLTR